MNKYIIIYAVIATIVCVFLVKSCTNQYSDNKRLITNTTALNSQLEEYKTKNGKDAVKLVQLQYTNSEYQKVMSQQANEIKQMGIKIKRLESMSKTGTKTETGGKTTLRDSIIYRFIDSVKYSETVKTFEWKDRWSTISGVIRKDSVDCKYSGTDTLTIICYRVPKKFLGFIPYGTKYIEQTILNANPNTKIVYAETVKLIKRRDK